RNLEALPTKRTGDFTACLALVFDGPLTNWAEEGDLQSGASRRLQSGGSRRLQSGASRRLQSASRTRKGSRCGGRQRGSDCGGDRGRLPALRALHIQAWVACIVDFIRAMGAGKTDMHRLALSPGLARSDKGSTPRGVAWLTVIIRYTPPPEC